MAFVRKLLPFFLRRQYIKPVIKRSIQFDCPKHGDEYISTVQKLRDVLATIVYVPEKSDVPRHADEVKKFSKNELRTLTMQDSFDRVLLPLGDDPNLNASYSTAEGKVRLDRLIADMDVMAALAITKEAENRLGVMETKMLLRVAGKSLMDHVKNDDLQRQYGMALLRDKLRENRLKWSLYFTFDMESDGKVIPIQELIERVADMVFVQKEVAVPKENVGARYFTKKQEDLPKLSIKESFDRVLVPMGDDPTLYTKYSSARGRIRVGKLLADMDLFASYIAAKHVKASYAGNEEGCPPFIVVTASVGQIDFINANTRPDVNIRISGHVCWVGTSSIEVAVWLEMYENGYWNNITKALFLMAARHAHLNTAVTVGKLVPKSDKEAEIIDSGDARQAKRQEDKRSSLLKKTPNEQEQQLIHSMFIKTMDPNDQTLFHRILPPNSKWMSTTLLSSVINCHPEDKNLYNKVFGGFLMRHSLELAKSVAYLHTNSRPDLVHISDIVFLRPVEIGSILQMQAHLCYTKDRYMQIMVNAQILNFEKMTSTTNLFHYTYQAQSQVPRIFPQTYNEAMMYIDGRRHFQHVTKLLDQMQEES